MVVPKLLLCVIIYNGLYICKCFSCLEMCLLKRLFHFHFYTCMPANVARYILIDIYFIIARIIKPLSDMNSFHQRRSQHKTIITTTTIYYHPHTIISKHPINSHYVAWHALVRQSSTVANRCTFYRPIRVFPTSNHDGYARLGITFWHYFP